jgi:hypothetical protein
MRTHSITVIILLLAWNISSAQPLVHSVKILSPVPNQEICLDANEVVTIAVSVSNPDTISRTLSVKFKIHNVITNISPYFQTIILPDVGPKVIIDTALSVYATNPNILKELGSFFACASVSALDSQQNPISNWQYTDSICTRLFGIRKTYLPFNDPSDGYSSSFPLRIPDQTKWVSIGATVVEGDSETWDPPPPRYPSDDSVGPDTLYAPLIRLDRSDWNGNMYAGNGVGDTLTSFPFNLKGQSRTVLTFDFMRTGKHAYPDLWDENMMTGPEQTVLDGKGNVLRAGDSLIIEFKDSAEPNCNPAKWDEVAAIDGGHDLEFQSFWLLFTASSVTYHLALQPPVTIPLLKNYLDSNFRFRLRLKANNNAIGLAPKDDDDPWYVDNISLQVPRHPEVEMKWVRVVIPYSNLVFSQVHSIPVYFSIRNITNGIAIGFPIRVWITNSRGDTIYNRIVNISSLPGGSDSIVRAPDWDASGQIFDSSPFTVEVAIATNGYDTYTADNRTYSIFYVNVRSGPGRPVEFAMDNPDSPSNAIPFITGKAGNGIGFFDVSGSCAVKFVLPNVDTLYGVRAYFASGNQNDDTIRISILQGDSNSCVPGAVLKVNGKPVVMGDVRKGQLFDAYWPYYFAQPIILQPGVYWCSVSQLTLNNYMLGGNIARGGAVITVADSMNPVITPIYNSKYGTQWSPTENNGDVSCSYAVETVAGSGNWSPWMPSQGYWPVNPNMYSNLAIMQDLKMTPPYIRAGAYLPMIRVMVGGQPSLNTVHSSSGQADDLSFESVFPNPLARGVSQSEISFTLAEAGVTSLDIYDITGRKVRTIINEKLDAGQHVTHWDGSDASGRFVAAGIYDLVLTEGIHSVSKQLIILQ